MGTLPLSFEQFSPSKRNRTNLQWQNSQISNLSTLWLPSTSPRKNGTNSPELSPRPLDSHWPRLLPALLNSTTNIAVCTLVMKIPTLTSLMSLTHSSANTTVKHFLWTMDGPHSSYSCLEIHICWKVEREAKMEPPIQTEYFLSGGAMILILMVDGAKAVISFCILSAIPGYMVVPPDMTVLAYKSLRMSTSHFMMEL